MYSISIFRFPHQPPPSTISTTFASTLHPITALRTITDFGIHSFTYRSREITCFLVVKPRSFTARRNSRDLRFIYTTVDSTPPPNQNIRLLYTSTPLQLHPRAVVLTKSSVAGRGGHKAPGAAFAHHGLEFHCTVKPGCSASPFHE